MYYSENKEQAGEFLRLALGHMAQYDVSPNPVNYTVWYEHVSGKNPKLSSAIEHSRKRLKSFNNSDLHELLYQRYVADGDRLIARKMLQETFRILTSLSGDVRNTSGEMVNHGNALEVYASQLLESSDLDSISRIIDIIILETKMMVESGKALKERLNESNKEINELREKLRKSRKDSVTDALTGLLNRRGFKVASGQELQKFGTYENGISLVMADIDHFKRINDTFGHMIGDSVIKMFATTFRDSLKGKDIVGRYGGEEFIMLLPDTRLEDAEKLCEKIRVFVQSMRWKRKDTGLSLGEITLSMGIAKYRQNESLDSLIHRADRALYFSKNNGRNRVTTEKNMHALDV